MGLNAEQPEWGEASFERERKWYSSLSISQHSNQKAEYQELRHRAIEDPDFDLFESFMPTGRPKYDIGRYVMRNAVEVPLIKSMKEWQQCLKLGTAMLRSELRQDYNGLSGLFSSQVLGLIEHTADESLRVDRTGYNPEEPNIEFDVGLHTKEPLRIEADGVASADKEEVLARDLAASEALKDALFGGLYDGTLDPAGFMRIMYWDDDIRYLASDAQHRRYKMPETSGKNIKVSRWTYIPGVNLRVFRDNIIEGKYYIGGPGMHDNWEVTEGRDSPNLKARGDQSKIGFYPQDYVLHTREIIDLYEKVRSLPYFAQNETPMIEMQYGNDRKLYFLQYLKTGLQISDPGQFSLPTGNNVVETSTVRGATSRNGEKVRIYLDPRIFTPSMEQQAFISDIQLGTEGQAEQVASMCSRVMIINRSLSFKKSHFDSSPLYRAPVALGIEARMDEAYERYRKVCLQRIVRGMLWGDDQVEYINGIITSNGRKATIESDWELQTEKVN